MYKLPSLHLRYCLRSLSTCAIVVRLLFCLTSARAAEEPLFDGKTLRGWTTLEGKPVTQGWEVADGTIHLKTSDQRVGHILSEREYGDFDLTFEWKIAPGGNSGLKYRVRDYDGYPRGCEYQILDDAKYAKLDLSKNSAGALYDLYEPSEQKHLKPPGEFNTARIVVCGNSLQHWLNGRLIVSATVNSPEWRTRLAGSKFAELQNFAQNHRGRIMLTDHGSEVWYRNFKFRPLDKD